MEGGTQPSTFIISGTPIHCWVDRCTGKRKLPICLHSTCEANLDKPTMLTTALRRERENERERVRVSEYCACPCNYYSPFFQVGRDFHICLLSMLQKVCTNNNMNIGCSPCAHTLPSFSPVLALGILV